MTRNFFRTPINSKAEVVSWMEADHIYYGTKRDLQYFGNHMDDDFDIIYILLGDRYGKFYCIPMARPFS